MLARDYGYKAPWELEREQALREQQQRELERKRIKEQQKQERLAVLRKYICLSLVIFLSSYGLIVFRSEAYASIGNELIKMKQEEKLLRNRNEELKIEVEELKGPTRIIRLAEQHLGMSVARSNIYVQSH